MGEEVNIRRLNTVDFREFYLLFERLIKNEIPELIKQSKFFLEGDFSRQRVLSALTFPKIAIFGYFKQNESGKPELIGFVWGNNGYAGLGFVSWIMVEQGNRSNGIGSTLLLYYEDYIRKIGGHVVELYCFEGMKEFYEKNSYEVIGIRPKGYFGLRQYIMDKLL